MHMLETPGLRPCSGPHSFGALLTLQPPSSHWAPLLLLWFPPTLVSSQGQREAFPFVSDGGQSHLPRSHQPWGWVMSLDCHTIACFTSSSLWPHAILPLPLEDPSLALLPSEVTRCLVPQDCHSVTFPRSCPLATVFSDTPLKHEHMSCPLAQASRGTNNLDTGSFGTPRALWAGPLLRGTRMAVPLSHQGTFCPRLIKSALVHTTVRA